MPLVDLTKFNGIPVGSIQFSPMPYPCGSPSCPVCYPVSKPTEWIYQTATKPGTGSVVDFTGLAADYNSALSQWKEDYAAFKAKQEQAELEAELKAAEEYEKYRESITVESNCCSCDCEMLSAAILDLTLVVEYLLVWTGKKGNKADRDHYLSAVIDAIRETV